MTDIALTQPAQPIDLSQYLAPQMSRAMSFIVHGGSKAGKSTFGATTPPPRLLIDVEMAYRWMPDHFIPGRMVFWDPNTQSPPQWDGIWTTCVVIVREYSHFSRAYDWLNSGQHPFKSVTIDSVSELQVQMKKQMDANGQMNQQKWGDLLFHMEEKLRAFRDLTEHPTKPIECIVLTSMTHLKDGQWRPYLQGQAANKLPYFFDVIGYVSKELAFNPADPTQPPTTQVKMFTGYDPMIVSGDRIGGRLPVSILNPNAADMVNAVFGAPTTN